MQLDLLWYYLAVPTSGCALILVHLTFNLPYTIWMMTSFFREIPREIEESALVDGANPNQAVFDVILPLIAPAMTSIVLIGFMASWTELALAWAFLTEPNRFTLAMGLDAMVGQYSSNTPRPGFAAMEILNTLPILVLYFLLQRWIVSGLVGAVKG